jgi:hypothetical protein
MLEALQCCISHTVEVSEFSKSLLDRALHQQLRLGHSHFKLPKLRVPSVQIPTVYVCISTFHP